MHVNNLKAHPTVHVHVHIARVLYKGVDYTLSSLVYFNYMTVYLISFVYMEREPGCESNRIHFK